MRQLRELRRRTDRDDLIVLIPKRPLNHRPSQYPDQHEPRTQLELKPWLHVHHYRVP